MSIDIVIYEDNSFLRNSLVEFLNGQENFKVVGAFENCNDVYQQMQLLQPKVVLMDISMDGVNGLEGLKLIKKYYPDILVMMLTVFEDNDNIFEALRNGANAYLLKSTAIEKIPEAIHDLISGGAPMTPSIARKVLNLFHKSKLPPGELYGLSPRELEVLHFLTTGHSYKMIADNCNISIETVRSHIKRIYDKLQVHSATEAANKISNKLF